MVRRAGIQQSMSAACYDNAFLESSFGTVTAKSRRIGRPRRAEAIQPDVQRILQAEPLLPTVEVYSRLGSELIEDLSLAAGQRRLRPALAPYVQPHGLVIDEIGYLTYSADAAHVLFQVVNHRYLHKKPMLLTTNKPLDQWGHVLHDADLAEAITGRVLQRGRFLRLRGPSYRTRHLKSSEKVEKEQH